MNVVHAIVQGAAAKEETDPLDLPPLHESVDTDDLTACPVSAPPAAAFRFTYHGYDVAVSDTEGVSVEAIEDDGERYGTDSTSIASISG
jgi:hypothetical protein